MKIVLFHPVRLPALNYGGVERVVLWLAQGLVELGHDVSVAALEGSQLSGGIQLIAMKHGAVSAHDLLPLLPPGVDVVHFMAPPEEGVIEKLPCQYLLTIHGNGKPGELFPERTVFLSQDHAQRHGRTLYVHNGIHPNEVIFDPQSKCDRLVFLSKTSWKVKNLHGAMKIARFAGKHLEIAGGNRPWGLRIQAALRPKNFTWLGPVSGERKAKALARARAFLFPVLWPEPFGLVVAESLMSGTPVVATKMGSLPELVPSHVGSLVEVGAGLSEWVGAIEAAARIEPAACRAEAMARFHYLAMAEKYLALYKGSL